MVLPEREQNIPSSNDTPGMTVIRQAEYNRHQGPESEHEVWNENVDSNSQFWISVLLTMSFHLHT